MHGQISKTPHRFSRRLLPCIPGHPARCETSETNQAENQTTHTNCPSYTNTNTSISASISPVQHRSQPIQIPSNPITKPDPDRVPKPTSGGGNRKGPSFPFSQSLSPRGRSQSQSQSQSPPAWYFSPEVPVVQSGLGRRRDSSTHSNRSLLIFSMHNDQVPSRYTPTSPLSPRIPSVHRPLSPQPQRRRINHSRQTSKSGTSTLPRFHPANFPQNEVPVVQPGQNPATTAYPRAPQPVQVESPRLMRERQRELIDRARMSSKIAASPMGVKPGAPRLDPSGSPKGPMTPLMLEEAPDYFQVKVGSNTSPAQSPGARSEESSHENEETGTSKGLPPPLPEDFVLRRQQ